MSKYIETTGTTLNVELNGFKYEEVTGTVLNIELQISTRRRASFMKFF